MKGKYMKFLSWDLDTEEAEIAILDSPRSKPDGVRGYVFIVTVRDVRVAKEMVRRWNAGRQARMTTV